MPPTDGTVSTLVVLDPGRARERQRLWVDIDQARGCGHATWDAAAAALLSDR